MSQTEIEYLAWEAKIEAANYEREAARDSMRPFYRLRPAVYPDGNQWCALYGENLQEGVCGFGDTPELAALDFDKNWGGMRLKEPKP